MAVPFLLNGAGDRDAAEVSLHPNYLVELPCSMMWKSVSPAVEAANSSCDRQRLNSFVRCIKKRDGASRWHSVA
jgi:hypothetical protein